MPEITEQREQKFRFTARTKVATEYEAAGFMAKVNTLTGLPYFPDVPAHVNSQMASTFAGLTVEWEADSEGALKDPATIITPVQTAAFPADFEVFQQCTWTMAMLTDITLPTKEVPTYVDRPFTVETKPSTAPPEKRIELMTHEFVPVWNGMATARLEGYTNTLPKLNIESKGVQVLCKNADTANHWMRETFGLDDLLRVRVGFQLGEDEILKNSEYLRSLWQNFLVKWLTEGGFDPSTVQLSANLIKNKKGQDMRLTKALAKVIPAEVPQAALERAQAVAYARKTPNRDSMLALLSTALIGNSSFWLTSNPADFATASWGGGFTSCHGPGREHFVGNIKLATTNNVLMAFVGEPHHKKGRMWIWVDKDGKNVWQLKSYGIFPSHLRQPVREYLEHCLEPNHPWKHQRNSSLSVTGQNGQGYFDACDFDHAYATTSKTTVVIDNTHRVRCVCCGNSTDLHNRSAACTSCECKDNRPKCSGCGCTIHDDVIELDDGVYCDGCVHFCDGCDEYTTDDGCYAANGNWYCDYHIEQAFFFCEYCEEYHHNDRRRDLIGGGVICRGCLDNGIHDGDIVACTDCGDFVASDNVVDGRCPDCHHEPEAEAAQGE